MTLTGSKQFGAKTSDLVLIGLADFGVLSFEIVQGLADDIQFIDLRGH